MMTGEYLDNNTKDEDPFPTNLTDELDAPLLLNDSLETLAYNPPCLYGQKGFRRPSIDLQSTKAKRQLIAATSICFIFMIAELIGGYAAGSLAIVTDAAHLLSDCISFIVALLAMWLSKKPPDGKMSFGYRRAEVLGAVLSVCGIWVLTAILVYLAFFRLLKSDFEIEANTMIVVSTIGVFINIIMGIVLHGSCSLLPHGHSHGPKVSTSTSNGSALHHQHSHSHSHNHPNNNTTTTIYLSPDLNGGRNYNNLNSFHNLNHNSSRSHSRHNSFTKILNNKTPEDIHANIDLLRPRIDEPLIHRMSFDGGLTRITVDNRSFSHSRLCDDLNNLQIIPPNVQMQHRSSVDSSHSSSGDSGRPTCEPKQNINIRAAVIHVIGDFIQSIGVLVAAIVIKMNPNAKIADPICTFLFSIIVIFTTVRIMKDSISVLLDAVPSSIILKKLDTELSCIQGVRSVHHLNVWSLTVDWNIMSVHLIIDSNGDTDEILQAATTIARKGFDIKHSTIQIEKSPQLMLSSEDNNTQTSLVQSSEDGDIIL